MFKVSLFQKYLQDKQNKRLSQFTCLIRGLDNIGIGGLGMRALIVREPYITHILQGRKTWEIRCSNCNIRERIGLIRSGSGFIVGTADIIDSKGPLSDEEFRTNYSKHLVPPDYLNEFRQRCKRKQLYAWVLANPNWLPKPVQYEHRRGLQIWVRVPEVPG